jgi:hypothetical protein
MQCISFVSTWSGGKWPPGKVSGEVRQCINCRLALFLASMMGSFITFGIGLDMGTGRQMDACILSDRNSTEGGGEELEGSLLEVC